MKKKLKKYPEGGELIKPDPFSYPSSRSSESTRLPISPIKTKKTNEELAYEEYLTHPLSDRKSFKDWKEFNASLPKISSPVAKKTKEKFKYEQDKINQLKQNLVKQDQNYSIDETGAIKYEKPFYENKTFNKFADNLVLPAAEAITYLTGAGETYQGLKTLANLSRLGVIKGLGKDALVDVFENKLTKSSLAKGLDKNLNQLGDLADYVNLDPIGLMSQTGLPHLPSSNIRVGWKWDAVNSKYIPDINYNKLGVAVNLGDKTYNSLPNNTQFSGTVAARQILDDGNKQVFLNAEGNPIGNIEILKRNSPKYKSNFPDVHFNQNVKNIPEELMPYEYSQIPLTSQEQVYNSFFNDDKTRYLPKKENGGTIMKKQYKKNLKKALNGDLIQPLDSPKQFIPNGNFNSQWDTNTQNPNIPGTPGYLEPLSYTQPKPKKQWWEQDDEPIVAPPENSPIQQKPTNLLPNPSTGLPKQFTGEDYDQPNYQAPDEFSPITKGPKKSLRNTQMGINAGLALLDNFIPEQQPKNNSLVPKQGQVQTYAFNNGAPLSNNSGIGQTAISKNGSTLYAENGLQVENDAYTPLSPSTLMLDGKSHAQGGVDITYGSNPVEAEKGEPISINDENNLVIFGNRKPKENPMIKQEVQNLGLNPNAKYKNLVKEIGNTEGKMQKKMNTASILLEENQDPTDKWSQLSFNSGKAMLQGTNAELNSLQEKKNTLGKLQEIQNAFFPDKKAKNGKTMKAGDGLTDYIRKPEENKQIDWTKSPENFTDFGIQPYQGDENFKGNASIYGTGDWNNLAKKAGFTGKGNDEFQKYLYNHPVYGDKIKALHQQYGTPKSGTWNDKLIGHRWDEAFNIVKDQPAKKAPVEFDYSNDENDYGTMDTTQVEPYKSKEETNTFNFNSNFQKKPFQKGKYDYLNDIGEIQALTYNPQAVNYSTLQPHLDQPYNVSFQDRRNQVQSNFRAATQSAGDNPAAQSVLMGQANEQLQPINGEEFRTNQGIYSNTLNSNNQKLDRADMYNSGQYDKMSENAAANKFNKFAVTKSALQSMGQKRLQFDQGQNELEAFSNALPNYNLNGEENTVDYAGSTAGNIFNNGYTPYNQRLNSETVTKDANGKVVKTTGKYTYPQKSTMKKENGGEVKKLTHSRMMKLL